MVKTAARDSLPENGRVHEVSFRSSPSGNSSRTSSNAGSSTPATPASEVDNGDATQPSAAPTRKRRAPAKPKASAVKTGGPALRFVTITDPKQVKSEQFKQNVRSQAMTSHMWNKFGSKREVKKAKGSVDDAEAVGRKRERLHEGVPDEQSAVGQLGTMFAASTSCTPKQPLGTKMDSFNIMTTIAEGHLDVSRILHHANRMYNTDYFNAVSLRRPATLKLDLLSSLMTANEHSNLVAGGRHESQSTIELTSLVLRLLREHIAIADSVHNFVTMTMLMKIMAAAWVANDDEAVKAHGTAMDYIVSVKGGMENLGPLRPYVVTFKLVPCIIYEQQPPPGLLDFDPRRYKLATTSKAPGSEEPTTICSELTVLGPHLRYFKNLGFQAQLVEADADPSTTVDFLPLRESTLFSKYTQGLLWNFRYVTNLFLDVHHVDRAAKASATATYRTALKDCLTYMQQQPSAANLSPDNAVANDWYFECCRLTFLVYLTALHLEIPFSEANELLAVLCNSVLPSTAFAAALLKTDQNNSWSDMSAVLITCLLINGAATSNIKKSSPMPDQRARKWIMIDYIRASSTLCLQPAWAFNGLLRIILNVQSTLKPRQL